MKLYPIGTHTMLVSIFVLMGTSSMTGCLGEPAANFCSTIQQCAEDEEDGFQNIDVDDDFHAVCTAQTRGTARLLRKNEAEECHVAADRYEEILQCVSELSCDDIANEFDRRDECEDQYEAFEDALDQDVSCKVAITANCSATRGDAASPFFGLALLIFMRRRQRTREKR